MEFVSADLEEDVISRIFRIYNTARVGVGCGTTGSGWVEPQEVSDWVESEEVGGWGHSKYVGGKKESDWVGQQKVSYGSTHNK